jgi:hypothetical protein
LLADGTWQISAVNKGRLAGMLGTVARHPLFEVAAEVLVLAAAAYALLPMQSDHSHGNLL